MCEHCGDDHRDNECANGLCPDCCGILCHHDEAPVTEKEAIKVATCLLKADWKGKDDFSKGMRLLQRHMKRKNRKKR